MYSFLYEYLNIRFEDINSAQDLYLHKVGGLRSKNVSFVILKD